MKSKSYHHRWFWQMSILCLSFSACDVINPEETLPTTIKIAPFEFNIESGQGTANNRITEVWLYANSDFLGAFYPPVDVNYLGEGSTQLTLRPGIRNNGILSDAIVYPMFTGYSTTLEAQSGAIVQVDPQTAYQPQSVFPLLADFEFDNPFLENIDTVSASNFIRSSVDVFEGGYSGQITLSQEAYFIEVTHVLPMSGIPTDGTSSYLEFRYKSEVEMSIGLIGINLSGQSFSNFFYLVNPSSEWNQLYIELTDWIEVSDLPSYKIVFRSLYPNTATKPEYNIFLDNIKVVHL